MKEYNVHKKRICAVALATICCVSACSALYSGIKTERISGILQEKTVEDLVAESEVIVRGTIADVSEPYQIQAVSGDVSIFTDYTIVPEQLLRAPEDIGDHVILRMQGGKIGKNRTIVDENPSLQKGDSGVFFLYRPHMGGGYNTLGDDYYYLSGMEQGAFLETGESSLFHTERGRGVELEVLTAQIAKQPEIHLTRETYLENLQYNLHEGFISQEEYDLFLAWMEHYAQILPR